MNEGMSQLRLVKVVDRWGRGTRMAHRRSLGFARDDKKERVIVRKARLLEQSAVAGAKRGCWSKARLLEESAVAGAKRGCWRKARLLEESAIAGGKRDCWRKRIALPHGVFLPDQEEITTDAHQQPKPDSD
jgi:hypothetical protein